MASSLCLSNLSFLSLPKPPPKSALSPLHLSSISHKTRSTSKFVSLASQSHSDDSSELGPITNPGFANANIMFFRSSYNVQVVVDENEPEERLLNRFRREVMRAGVIQECKRRRHFENSQDEKKRKSREAAKRNRRRRPQSGFRPANNREVPTTKKDDEDEDNWELPEGGLPY